MDSTRTPLTRLLIILALIFSVEALVMVVMRPVFDSLLWWQEALLDACLLSALVYPLLHLLFFRPLLDALREKEKAEKILSRAHRELEEGVRGRTAELEASKQRLEQEIDGRRAVEEELAKAKEDWEEAFDTINDAITIHDRSFNIIRANRAAVELLGTDMETVLARKCYESYHGTECPPEECPSCRTLETGGPAVTEIFEPHLNRYLEIKALPRVDRTGELTGLIHIVRDIDERKKAEQQQQFLQAQLIQAQKMETIGRLAGGVAHDFNNILTIILSCTGFALKDLPSGSPVLEDIRQVREAGERAVALTRQLLAFSRKQVLDLRVVDLKMLIENMEKMLGRMIGEDITLQVNLQEDACNVLADPGQIEQIIMNLAVNARDAMPDGGHLIIETAEVDLDQQFVAEHEGAQPGSYCMLALTDTGHGMPPEVRDKVFDPFFTTKEAGKGTGLGLSTVYGIVKQHNGYIYLYSEEGKGTTFKVFLPVTEEEEEAREKERADFLRHGSETVLVAEDDPHLLRLLAGMLEPLGYRLLTAADGDGALRIAENHLDEIDLLLTDVIMPGLNGRELADRLLELRPGIKVVFMSGYTDETISQFNVLKSEEVFIQKPLTPSTLLKAIKTVLDQ